MNIFCPWNVYTNTNIIWCKSSIYILKQNTMIGLCCQIQARRMESIAVNTNAVLI